MNSVQEALYYGVPLAMAPQAADQFWISARASELGAALVLDPPRMEPRAIRGSVAKILSATVTLPPQHASPHPYVRPADT